MNLYSKSKGTKKEGKQKISASSVAKKLEAMDNKQDKGMMKMGGVNGALKGLLPGAPLNAGKGVSKEAKQVKGEMKNMKQTAKKQDKKRNK